MKKQTAKIKNYIKDHKEEIAALGAIGALTVAASAVTFSAARFANVRANRSSELQEQFIESEGLTDKYLDFMIDKIVNN